MGTHHDKSSCNVRRVKAEVRLLSLGVGNLVQDVEKRHGEDEEREAEKDGVDGIVNEKGPDRKVDRDDKADTEKCDDEDRLDVVKDD